MNSDESHKHKLVIERYGVILYNDAVNTMENVVHALMDTFLFDPEKALRLMFQAHTNGKVLCAVELLEPAEFHYHRLTEHGLKASLQLIESKEN